MIFEVVKGEGQRAIEMKESYELEEDTALANRPYHDRDAGDPYSNAIGIGCVQVFTHKYPSSKVTECALISLNLPSACRRC